MYPTRLGKQCCVLVDTPGFDDANRSDLEVLSEILKWFEAVSPYCTLAGILYVHDITQARFTASAKLNVHMLQALCGPDFYPNVTIVTTKWGNLVDKAQRAAWERQRELEGEHWDELITGGARVFAYRNGVAEPYFDDKGDSDGGVGGEGDGGGGGDGDDEKHKRARTDLEEMMDFYRASQKIIPEIQRELRKGIHVHDTEAGRALLQRPEQLQQQCSPETKGDGSGNPCTAVTTPDWANDQKPFSLKPPSNSHHCSLPAGVHPLPHLCLRLTPHPHQRAEPSAEPPAADPLLGQGADGRGCQICDHWDAMGKADPCCGCPREPRGGGGGDGDGDGVDDAPGNGPQKEHEQRPPPGTDDQLGVTGGNGGKNVEQVGYFRRFVRAVWYFVSLVVGWRRSDGNLAKVRVP